MIITKKGNNKIEKENLKMKDYKWIFKKLELVSSSLELEH